MKTPLVLPRVESSASSTPQPPLTGKLVCSEQLLDALFDPGCRPSVRWLRNQVRAGVVPEVKIGHLCFFDVPAVKAALAAKNLVRGRYNAVSEVKS